MEEGGGSHVRPPGSDGDDEFGLASRPSRLAARARAHAASPRPGTTSYQGYFGRARPTRPRRTSRDRERDCARANGRRRRNSIFLDGRDATQRNATRCDATLSARVSIRVSQSPGTWPPDVIQRKTMELSLRHTTHSRARHLFLSIFPFLSLSFSRTVRGFTPSRPNRRSCLSCKGHVYGELRSCKQDVRRR